MIKGITAGCWDLCHAGHILMFKEAKKVCNYLVVCLQKDPSITDKSYRGKKKNKPIMSMEERRIILEGIKYIDEIIEYETEEDLYKIFEKRKDISVRIIGEDWRGKKFTGYDLPMKVYFNERKHNYSTSELRKRVFEAELSNNKEKVYE